MTIGHPQDTFAPYSHEPPTEAQPLVSVILPMQEHRGLGLDSLKSWIHAQQGDPARFEVIVLLDETVQAFAPALRHICRSQDIICSVKTLNVMEQYDLGAKQARGRYLFFTEPHCLVESDAVTEIVRYFETHTEEGCFADSIAICRTQLASFETKLMFEAGVQERGGDADWLKVRLRGFGLQRTTYVEIGGWPYQYGKFAEWLFAAMLHAKGDRIGYAVNIRVHHVNAYRFEQFDTNIKIFVEDECRYRLQHETDEYERYFGIPPEWLEMQTDTPTLMATLSQVLWQRIRTRQGMTSAYSGWIICSNQYLRLMPSRLLGKRALWLQLRLSVWRAKWRCVWWRWHEQHRYLAFSDYWTRSAAWHRVNFMMRQDMPIRRPLTPRCVYHMNDCEHWRRFGFYALEIYEGQPFRWSSAVAAFRVTLNPEDYQGTIQLHKVRPIVPETELSLFANTTPIQEVTHDPVAGTLCFTVAKQAWSEVREQWLIVLCTPLVSLNDRRSLGLPIISVSFTPHIRSQEV